MATIYYDFPPADPNDPSYDELESTVRLWPSYSYSIHDEWKTDVISFENGAEQRAQRHQVKKRGFHLEWYNLIQTEVDEIRAFFNAEEGGGDPSINYDTMTNSLNEVGVGRGSYRRFKFRDLSETSTTSPIISVTAADFTVRFSTDSLTVTRKSGNVYDVALDLIQVL